MCAVSAVGDSWARRDSWPNYPSAIPWAPTVDTAVELIRISNEFAKYKKEHEAKYAKLLGDFKKMRQELEEAKTHDIREGNPDCEMDAKVAAIKKIAEVLNESLGTIFNKR